MSVRSARLTHGETIMKTPGSVFPGQDLLNRPTSNRGTAFTDEERSALRLHGLLPPQVETLDEQAKRMSIIWLAGSCSIRTPITHSFPSRTASHCATLARSRVGNARHSRARAFRTDPPAPKYDKPGERRTSWRRWQSVANSSPRAEFPANGEQYRNFLESGLPRRLEAQTRCAISGTYAGIPCAQEQGIFLAEQMR